MAKMEYVRVQDVPGMTRYRLLREWAGLEAGTEVRPSSVGFDNSIAVPGEHVRTVRTVTVLTGPRAGAVVSAEDE